MASSKETNQLITLNVPDRVKKVMAVISVAGALGGAYGGARLVNYGREQIDKHNLKIATREQQCLSFVLNHPGTVRLSALTEKTIDACNIEDDMGTLQARQVEDGIHAQVIDEVIAMPNADQLSKDVGHLEYGATTVSGEDNLITLGGGLIGLVAIGAAAFYASGQTYQAGRFLNRQLQEVRKASS